MNPFIGLVFLSLVGVAISDDYCLCGQEVLNRRIINGKVADKGRFPWMTSVMTKREVDTPQGKAMAISQCGGSLINDRYILTAAHCMDRKGMVAADVMITLGAQTQQDRYENNLEVASFKVHEKWTGSTADGNDIALIRLKSPVKYDQKVSPVCLAGFNTMDDLFITGWGNQANGLDTVSATELYYGDLKQNPDAKCHRFFGSTFKTNATHVCAGLETGTCQGDSGGPVSVRKNGHVYQYSIVSYGAYGCGIAARHTMKDLEAIPPSVSERVINHKDWIKKNTADAVYCKPGAHEQLF
jgi:secreted trypsin-like serine protease